ncbi:hypothetical protein MCHI_003201 [Candidatus Magnetoovum chiemensis]|nr:hypothetical protein MCHI_003201 [Candidatus Magnetoovum chiemensis]
MRIIMKVIWLVIFALSMPINVFAHEIPADAAEFQASEECSACHVSIYKEWKDSMHAKSSALSDNAHQAAYNKFKESKEGKGPYHCATCHAPMSNNMDKLLKGEAELNATEWTNSEGTGCTFCHRIEAVIEGKDRNLYRINKDGAIYTGLVKGNAPHKVSSSALFQKGEICLGCHSHLINPKGAPICIMSDEGISNCLSCHMTETEGAPATNSYRTTHISHKIQGGHSEDMLKKAVTLQAAVSNNNLSIEIKNNTAHSFPSTMPMRMAYLKINYLDKDGKVIWSNFKEDPMENKDAVFMKAFKAGETVGVASWDAEDVAINTWIKAGQTLMLTYPVDAEAVHSIKITLNYRLFAPKGIELLNIPKDGVNDKVVVVAEKIIIL